MEIKLKAPAKINLSLDVLGKRPDGYHELATVMQTVGLYDTVTLSDNDSGRVTVSCDAEGVPCDDSNICAKAAYRFFDYCRLPVSGVHIDIKKTIPAQAGLAGGSSDGAAVIVGLNQLFHTKLSPREMTDIAARVGADVPFCLAGGTRLCTGIGETMTKLPALHGVDIVICKPDTVSVSTAEAYRLVDALPPHGCYTDEMVKALYSRDLFMVAATLFNDFELALQIPEVAVIKKKMLSMKAKGAGMSGSGSAVFALFSGEKPAKKCAEALKADYPQTFLCKPVKTSCFIE